MLQIMKKNVITNLASKAFSTVPTKSNLVKINDNFENKFLTKIIMDNQKQRNSLGIDMIRALRESIKQIDLSKCRVLVIGSSCPKVFSAGHNLKEFTHDKGQNLHKQVFNEFTDLCLTLKNLPVPTIAEVQGLAAAAGYQLAASCDLIVASNKASFSTPGVKFGVFCSTPAVPLSRNVSPKISLKMLFTGDAVTADEAYTHGIISEVVNVDNSSENLEKKVFEIARKIEANSRFIVTLGKKCFYKQIEAPELSDAYKIASEVMLDNLMYEDTQLGLNAFATKTKPIWTHSAKKLD
ncbi:enoyl- hydratase domain-containing mitochondrial [Brachionus plicatilis]|uniref:Enoyl-CoA hydratase domain-containing protein 3, mitochondrial n=1 Tax=Brachionus plicatilis TaxID=10195 RepID=A0A3M7RCB9_BRAPC|nr:enoyl- hydratase domain-containing mitochondrial [Brachionus plicatilis]